MFRSSEVGSIGEHFGDAWESGQDMLWQTQPQKGKVAAIVAAGLRPPWPARAPSVWMPVRNQHRWQGGALTWVDRARPRRREISPPFFPLRLAAGGPGRA